MERDERAWMTNDVMRQVSQDFADSQDAASAAKSMLCASAAQLLSGYAAYPPNQLQWLLASYFDLSPQEKTRYYITEVFLDEHRYIIQNEDLLDFTMADVAHEIRRIGEYLPCMVAEITAQRFAVISLISPEAPLRQWHIQPFDEHAFITALYDCAPVAPEGVRGKLAEMLMVHNNFVLSLGSGQIKTLAQAQALIDGLPYESRVCYNIDPLIEYLIAGDEDHAQAWLDEFFRTHTSQNIHLLTIELLDRIDRQLMLLPTPIPFSSKRKTLLIKRLLDLESATMLRQMMQTYLQDMMMLIEPRSRDNQSRIVRDTIQYIKTHYNQPFTIDELAEEMHYSPNHLRYVFKHVTGRTLSEEITDTRLERARRMLQDTSMRVHQIAKQVGYTNPSYFIAQFTKKYGLTPVQYRNRGNI